MSENYINITVTGENQYYRFGRFIEDGINKNKFIFNLLLRKKIISDNDTVTVRQNKEHYHAKVSPKSQQKPLKQPDVLPIDTALELETPFYSQKCLSAKESLKFFLESQLKCKLDHARWTTLEMPHIHSTHSGGGLLSETLGLGLNSVLSEKGLYGAIFSESGISGGSWYICSVLNEKMNKPGKEPFKSVSDNIKSRIIKMGGQITSILFEEESIHEKYTDFLKTQLLKRDTKLCDYTPTRLIEKEVPLPILIAAAKFEKEPATIVDFVEMTPISTNLMKQQKSILTANFGKTFSYNTVQSVYGEKALTLEYAMAICGCVFSLSADDAKRNVDGLGGLQKLLVKLIPDELTDSTIIAPPSIPSPLYRSDSQEVRDIKEVELLDYGVVSNCSLMSALARNSRIILVTISMQNAEYYKHTIENFSREYAAFKERYKYSFPKSLLETTYDQINFEAKKNFIFVGEKDGDKLPAMVVFYIFKGEQLPIKSYKLDYDSDDFDQIFNIASAVANETGEMVAEAIRDLILG